MPVSNLNLEIHLNTAKSNLKEEVLEAVVRRCSSKKLFLKISQISYIPTELFSCEICEIVKNALFHRTPPVAASEEWTAEEVRNFPCLYDR